MFFPCRTIRGFSLLAASLASFSCFSSQEPDCLALSSLVLSCGHLVRPDFGKDSVLSAFVAFEEDTLVVQASANQEAILSGDLLEPHALNIGKNTLSVSLYSLDQKEKRTYTLNVYRLNQTRGLSSLYLNTGNKRIDSQEKWVHATYELRDSSGDPISQGKSLRIKGRGNFTWMHPKKPYVIQLDEKESLLGMPAHKKWVLLANYLDKTLLRNDFAFYLGQNVFDRIGWTPRSEFVELYLDSLYEGVYQLTEKIEVDAERLNIPVASGSFLVEADQRQDEEQCFATRHLVSFCLKEPEKDSKKTFSQAMDILKKTEDWLYADFSGERNYASYLDLPSFIDWYLVNEFTKNVDANFFTSVYMYYHAKERRLHMGPLWDFDVSSGNADYNGCDDAAGFYVKDAQWMERLFADSLFVRAVQERWMTRRQLLLETIDSFIKYRASYLENAQEFNFYRWNILDKLMHPNRVVTGCYQGEIEAMRQWLEARFAWMDQAIADL